MRHERPTLNANSEPPSSEQLAGDLAPLSLALGSPDALTPLGDLAQLLNAARPQSASALRAFLRQYRDQLLAAVELPAIRAAYQLASQGKGLDLIALDRELSARFGTSSFAEASRHTGRTQLRRLRPLRDRSLQRYLAAVDEGQASGWHVVVFGLLLALFSLPLRQGLAHYAQKTHQSILDSATLGVALTAADRESLVIDRDAHLVSVLKNLVPSPALSVV